MKLSIEHLWWQQVAIAKPFAFALNNAFNDKSVAPPHTCLPSPTIYFWLKYLRSTSSISACSLWTSWQRTSFLLRLDSLSITTIEQFSIYYESVWAKTPFPAPNSTYL